MKAINGFSILSILKFALLLAGWLLIGYFMFNTKLEETGGITAMEYLQKIADGTITTPTDSFKDITRENAQAIIGGWNVFSTTIIIYLVIGIGLNIISMIFINITKSSVLAVIFGLIKLISGSFISAIVYFVQSGKLQKN